MTDGKYRLKNEISLAVSTNDADKLIARGDGTAALLYLYALRKNGVFSANDAAMDLKRTPLEIKKAAEILGENGLFSQNSSAKLPQPAEELPEYTAEDISRRSSADAVFPVILAEAQNIMGKTLSGVDMKILFGIYDHLGLPPEVAILLINHCVESTRERLGAGRLPTMRTIEKEAYIWFNREILTLDRAEEFLQNRRILREKSSEIKRILQISDRNFSTTEREYVEKWLNSSFDAEAIALAYDRTVIKTGGLKWKYMDSILSSWHGKNLHTTDEILAGDGRGRQSPTMAQGSDNRDDLELLKKILNK